MREVLLQRTLVDLIFEPEAGEELERDPVAFGAGRGLESKDTAALLRFKDRLGIYRELARASLAEPLQNIFPITRALVDGHWEACLSTFLAARCVRSPHYRDIASAFVEWLSESGWGKERWPFLLALAHFEYVEVMVGRWPETPSNLPLLQEPSPEHRIVLPEGAQVLSYAFAVHRATVESPVPREIPTHLLATRDPEGTFRVLELTPATAALLVRGQEESLASAAACLGIGDMDAAMALLKELIASGAIRGFRMHSSHTMHGTARPFPP